MTDTNETLTRQASDEAQACVDRIAERLRGQGPTVQTRIVLHTHPVDSILEEAREGAIRKMARTPQKSVTPILLQGRWRCGEEIIASPRSDS
jgi:hypothetical protein